MKKSPGKKPLLAIIRDKVSDILSGTNGKIMFNSSQSHNTLFDEDYELYIEHYFNQRLCFERKRTERSKNPFLMMLLNIEEFEINKIKISIHLFPEKDNDRKSDNLPDLHLYPDVTAQGIEKKDKLILKRIIDIGGGCVAVLIFSPL